MADEVHLLWTGGWDSTYRLLEILAQTQRNIQPHYIVDRERTSWDLEMEAMDRLRSAVAERRPEWAGRVRETWVTERREIVRDAEIERAFATIRAGEYIGQQYCWLARYASMRGVLGLELCIESTDAAGRQIRDKVREVPGSDPPLYELVPAVSGRDRAVAKLFGWFRFPLVHRDKKDMEIAIERAGAWPIMAGTWFCHQPVLARYPCGTCRPCVYVVNKGQAWRIGRIGRIRFNCIERPRRLLPAGMKKYARGRLGQRLKRFIRA